MSFYLLFITSLLLLSTSTHVGAQVTTLVAFEANISGTVLDFTQKIHDTVNGCNATQLSYYSSPYSTRFYFNTIDTGCSSAVKAMSPEMRAACSITSMSWHDGQYSLPPASQWEYAVSGGGNAGVLLVRPSAVSPWGTVCDDSFSNREALVACRALGFSTIRATFTSAGRLQTPLTNVPIYMDNVQCANASATRLSDCSFTYSTEFVKRHNCIHDEDILLDCSGPSATKPDLWGLRLAQTERGRGRLEMRPDNVSAWGTLCSAGFDNNAALAACHSLGYNVTFAYVMRSLAGAGPVYIDYTNCSVGANSLRECTFHFGLGSCDYEKNVGLDCRGIVMSNNATIVAYTASINVTKQSVADTVRLIADDVSANVARVWVFDLEGPDSANLTIIHFRFTDQDQSVWYTAQSRDILDRSLLSVDRSSLANWFGFLTFTSNATRDGRPTTWEFSITGSSPYAGLLSVRPSSAAAWGTVCDDSFDATAALAACRSIGYPSTSAIFLSGSPNHNTGTGPIYMDDVMCPVGSTNLMNCTYTYSTETVTNHDCTHSEDVTINCFPNGGQPFYQPPASAWQYKLDNGYRSAGVLLIRPSAVSPWGTVCDDSFSNREALVACRSLGYANVSKAAFYTRSTSLTSPIYMDEVQCSNVSATRLSDCSFNYSTEFVKRHDCTHAEDIYLDCAPVERPTTWEFSITGSSPYAGLLSVRPSSAAAWGTVCDDSFDATAALAACRSVGYPSNSATVLTYNSPNHNTGTGPIYMDDVVCPVGSTNLMNCTYTYSTETVTNHDCTHSEDVTINCFPNGGQPFYQPPASAWQYKLDGGISGLLLVRPSGVSPWGTVCDDSFTNREALVACRALGFSNIVQAAFYSSSSFLSAPIYMDDVQCTDSGATRLSDCSFTYSTEFVARHDCNHYKDIYLDCSGYSLPVAGRWFADPGAFPGLVVGCVLGSMVVVGIIVGVSIYCCCRRRYQLPRQVEPHQVATDALGSSNQPVVGVYAHNHEPLEMAVVVSDPYSITPSPPYAMEWSLHSPDNEALPPFAANGPSSYQISAQPEGVVFYEDPERFGYK